MDKIIDAIGDAIHDFFVNACGGMFIGIFDDANASVANVSKDVALTPAEWNKSIFSMIQNLSNNVIIPIAGLIITAVLCYELITTITEKNNMHDVETFIFFKFCFKACVAVMLLSHTFEITMAIFDVGQWIVNKSAASIANDTYVDVNEIYLDFKSSLDKMDTGSLIVLIEKTIIDRCVRLVYREYLANPETAEMPVLQDLYNLILSQPEPEAIRIATALEMYVTGSLNIFNHRTNVDMNNRLICFDIKELGKQLKKLGMLVVQDCVWNRVTVNRAEHKSTRYYIDEFHLLLKEEQTAAYSVEIWKRFRKWGGIPTGLTQNVKDLLSSREVDKKRDFDDGDDDIDNGETVNEDTE